MRNYTRKHGQRAFTLIELMVVMLILAVLAALVVPKLLGRVSEAKVAAAKSDIATMARQVEAFRIDCDRYPTTDEGLQALRVQPSDVQGWKGPYLDKDVPEDPWHHPYIYESPGPDGEDSFVIYSYGADGVEGGDAGTDNADIYSSG
ncbi:MAG TPA: type II secretion system major pseudopilin GspG [Fimbriimonadaceae bacterium]|nr:type II secretion system major pseudopilin GspG [Fimbriimonadaceae bacterium]